MSNKDQKYESYGLMVSPPAAEENDKEIIKQDPKSFSKKINTSCNSKQNQKKTTSLPQYNVTQPQSNPTNSPQSVQVYHPQIQSNVLLTPSTNHIPPSNTHILPSNNHIPPSNSCQDQSFNSVKPPTGRENSASAQAHPQNQTFSSPQSQFVPQQQQKQHPAGGGIYSATDRETPFQYYMLDQQVPVLTQGTVYPGHLLPMAQALTEIINHLSILPGCPAPPMGRIWEALEVGIGACGDGRKAGLKESDSLQAELCGLLLVRAGLYMKSGYRNYASTDLQYILNHIDPYCDEAYILLEELES